MPNADFGSACGAKFDQAVSSRTILERDSMEQLTAGQESGDSAERRPH